MKLKVRTHQDTLDELECTVGIILDIDPDHVSGSIMINHNRYYCIVTENKITEWSHNDICMMFHKKYEVAK